MAGDALTAKTENPVALGSFRSWATLLWNTRDIDTIYIPRALYVTLSTLFTSPLRLYEQLRYGEAVRNTPLHPSPIFIIGHWRTGTTHLHNLMSKDTRLGFVSTFQTIAPGFCLAGDKTIGPFLDRRAKKAHRTRVIDNIPLEFDAPQEEEFAIANMSPYSLIHQYSFPRQAPFFFEKYTLFQDLPERIRVKWIDVYLTILRKATLRTGGKRLVLKSPNNTARIGTLLELFPGAKFIHICRNPYRVFRSTRIVYERVLPGAQLQKISMGEIDTFILRFYDQLMRKYIADRPLIPAGNLVEVKFEHLEVAPLAQLRRIYDVLRLPGFAEAEPAFSTYLSSIEGYQKNSYEIDAEVIAKVNRHWQFAFDEWGYDRLAAPSECGQDRRP
jgi:hypothetical protein